MIHKRLKVLILSAAFLSLPIVKAFDWKATGDLVGADGFAYATGNVYNEGDRVINTGSISEDSGGETSAMRSPRKVRSKTFKDGHRTFSRVKYRTGRETDVVTPGGNTEFEATASDSVLNLYGTLNGTANGDQCALKVDGDIILKASSVDMTVNVKSDVTFIPYIDPTGDAQGLGGDYTGTGFAQLHFNVAAGKKITVNADHNLEFKGRTLAGTTTAFEPIDMFVSFRGAGQVTFNMADGTAVKFNGDIDDTFKVDMISPTDTISGVSNNAAGTKVLICMDQTATDADKGLNKVLFTRKTLANESKRNMIFVGPNSGFFYVSTDVTGKAHLADATVGGYGSVAFDVSNQGTGRTVLFLKGARTFGWDVTDSHGNPLYASTDPEFNKVAGRYLFNDASFVVAGVKVDSYAAADLRTTLNYSVPAGAKASLRVVDNLAYAGRTAGQAFDTTAADRRGLLLINDTETIAKLASDNYWDFWNGSTGGGEMSLPKGMKRQHMRSKGKARSEESSGVTNFGHDWAYSAGVADQTNLRNTRTGFVLGVNGECEVYHNTFLDYVAGTANRVDDLALNDYQDYNNAAKGRAVLAERNPSAFVTDGLDSKLFTEHLSAFEAANPALTASPVLARINLRGNGGIVMRASASEDVGYIAKFWQLAAPGDMGMSALRSVVSNKEYKKMERANLAVRSRESGNSSLNPIDIATLDWDTILTVGESKFNGYSLDKITDVTSWNGMSVMDVEGGVRVSAHSNDSTIDSETGAARQYASVVNNAGFIGAVSTAIDYTGANVVARPLAFNSTYARYNSPVIYMNDNMTLAGSILVHSDVTKLVDGVPTASRPAIKGGERMYFSDKLWTFDGTHADMRYRLPELRILGGELDLQESLNMAGVRLVATDTHGEGTRDNTAVVRFFDHGSALDSKFTGYGRLLMLGSYNNTMADGKSNWVTESSYINSFKQNTAPTAQGSTAGVVKLSLTNGDQFPSSVAAADYDAQRGLHLVLSSIMDKGGTNVAAGWTSTDADSSGASFPYGNTRYENELLKEVLPSAAADKFVIDALKVPAAQIVVSRGTIGFSGFDRDGKASKTPISYDTAQGVVFVNHGGKISVDSGLAVIDTVVAQRVWNDYNFEGNARVQQLSGVVDLPHEQSSFTKNGGVQAFGLTKAMLDARASETDGYVRLSYENPERSASDRSGADEVVINWFNTESQTEVKASPTRSLAASVGNAKAAKRVTRSNPSAALNGPMARPARLLYVGSGDDIRQMRVAGATQTNPFILEVSGDDVTRTFGRVREFATQPSMVDLNTDYRVSEGSHAVLFGVLGGRMGLGSTQWNDYSANPWNILGKDFVQVAVEGDCVVDVNSNLIIADNQAIVAVDTFGQVAVERVTFTSVDEREIRIPSGVELDLSSFGKGAKRQEIAFGGKVKLVIESGASIRGPRTTTGGVVLYFNDEAQLVFESPSDRATGNKPYAGTDNIERSKFLGKFQIWLNKSAKMSVGDGVLVGVQSDASTPITDVAVSLNRQSRFEIGNTVSAGGAFEVGNPVAVTGGSVKFELASRHVDSVFHIDRQGFLGLGAGVMEKQSNMNGTAAATANPAVVDGKAVVNNGVPSFTAASNAWKVAPRFNVDQITINFLGGNFEHNNIADGSDSNAALIAVGPSVKYDLKLNGAGSALVKGGGNIMLVPASATAGLLVNAWDYATAFPDGSQYQLLGAGQQILNKDTANTQFNAGKAYTFTSAADFFNAVSVPNYSEEVNKLLPFASVNGVNVAAAVNLDAANTKYPATAQIILRRPVASVINGLVVNGLEAGLAVGVESDDLGPTSFGIPVGQ